MIDLRIGEARFILRCGRVFLLRLPIAYGFALGYTGRWGLWSKRGTVSRAFAEWAGLRVEDLL